jgi:hypothetical protein
MGEDIRLPFDLPAVARKKVSAAFDGGRITSDGGVMLLAQAERRLGIADHLARVIPDERDADRGHCQVNGIWVAVGVPLCRAGCNRLVRLRTNPGPRRATPTPPA